MPRYSWGNYPPTLQQQLHTLNWHNDSLAKLSQEGKLLPYGRGRSYGDVCLNQGGLLLDTSQLNHFITFDKQQGILRCEAGVTLAEILALCVPHGWFLPVLPGTQTVSVGGAIANDIHGKNHLTKGSFAAHVTRLAIKRSDDQIIECSATQNSDWFKASVGGLGLTGLILWAEIQLTAIQADSMQVTEKRFSSIEQCFELQQQHAKQYEYQVAWLDCHNSARGVLHLANHSTAGDSLQAKIKKPRINIPCFAPNWLLNKQSIRSYNQWHYYRHRHDKLDQNRHYQSFFFPLDGIDNWNRLYGRRGFVQLQCVMPEQAGVKQLLDAIVASGQASFLSVLKWFGNAPSAGLLSFTRPGISLALDFPMRGETTKKLLAQLHQLIVEHDGAVYPAKDALLTSEQFRQFFPAWEQLIDFIDPNFCSDFWRRINTR